jgi:acylglycerol lipase
MDFPPQERTEHSDLDYVPSEDGTKLAVRVVGRQGAQTPVIMLHGLQSHSGWFVQSQAFLADLGFPVYAMDRRGSGLSEGSPGECVSFREMGNDVRAVAEWARMRHGKAKVHVFGHCFGTIPAVLFAGAFPELVASLILASSGIYTKVGVDLATKLRILWSKAWNISARFPIPLMPEMFSELEKGVRFIREDETKLRSVTASFYYEVLRAKRHIRAHRHRITMPVFMANAGEDPICDTKANARFLASLPASHRLLITYGKSRHVIEFSQQRDDFFADLGWWLDRFERSGNGRRLPL